MRTSRLPLALALVLGLCSCGGTSTATRPEPRTRAPRGPADAGVDARRGPSPRALGATANFGELVRAARTLEDRGEDGASAGCLLRGTGEVGAAWRLEADVAVAVRPLPAAWDDYDAHLRAHRGPARILSRWGVTRAESYALALVTFTSTVPVDVALPAAVVVLTDEGAYVLGTTEGTASASAPVPLARVNEALLALRPNTPPALVAVTAEANVPLGALREALSLLGALGVPVTLGVPLAPDVRLPEERPVAPDVAERGLCARGLPEAPADATEGDLAASAVMDALGPLRDAAARCLSVASGRAAAGGRIDVTLRIGADGTVGEACALRDEPLDPALRLCVLEAARALHFPAPSPAGYVDVVLPLRLAADATLEQRPLCD
jgi:hypothetical protein